MFTDKYLFCKYPEIINNKDAGSKTFNFVEGDYDAQTIVAETMRGYTLAALTGATFLLPKQAPQEQLENIKLIFGISAKTILFDNDKPCEYINILNNLPKKSLQVMFPYEKINPDIYQTTPKQLLELNDKSKLHNLTTNTPHEELLTINEIINKKPPFVLKKITGACGDGIKIVTTTENKKHLKDFFLPNENIIFQEYIEAENNYGVQFLTHKGNTYYLGKGIQNIGAEGDFESSTYSPDTSNDKTVLSVAHTAANAVAKKGYEGFFGFDILKKEKQAYIIDPNIRITGASPLFILKIMYQDKLPGIWSITSGEKSASSPQKLIDTIQEKGDILLSMSHGVNNKYKYFYLTNKVSLK